MGGRSGRPFFVGVLRATASLNCRIARITNANNPSLLHTLATFLAPAQRRFVLGEKASTRTERIRVIRVGYSRHSAVQAVRDPCKSNPANPGRTLFLSIKPMSPPGPFEVHVVSHTHWDREWYLPFPVLRQRLVALVDELLDAPPVRSAFLLDGQAIVIDDYLAVRSDREPELRALLVRGALEAGPWYVLADELLTSGEALVRNLLTGTRTVRERGGRPLPVLYCPDSFGHPADLPTLAEQFGFPLIILWRGFGGPAWLAQVGRNANPSHGSPGPAPLPAPPAS